MGVFKDFMFIYGTKAITIFLGNQNLARRADLTRDDFLNFWFQNFTKADLGVKINVSDVSYFNLQVDHTVFFDKCIAQVLVMGVLKGIFV